MMGKKFLREEQMSDVAVNQAASWARVLTQCESRGPGDLPNAWRRLEARYGVPVQTFWALRYRRPKDILASIYLQLSAAYQAECQRQMRKLAHEIHITEQIAGADHPAVVAAKAVVDAAASPPANAPRPTKLSAAIGPDDLEIPEFLRRPLK